MQPENKISTPSLVILYNVNSPDSFCPGALAQPFHGWSFLLFRSLLIASSEKAFTGKPSAVCYPILMFFPGGSEGKEYLPAMWETWV